MNWFKVHEDYDKLEDPGRLWIMLYLMLPFFIGLAILDMHRIAGVIGIILGCIMGIYRIIYIGLYESRKGK